MLKSKLTKRSLYELVVVPLVLAVLGYLLLLAADGSFWGVALWVVAAPLVYLLIDVFVFAQLDPANVRKRGRPTAVGRPTRPGKPREAEPRPDSWSDVRRTSTGGEILRRGRRYDRRTG